ncbi:MAG: hypothetical protein ACOX3T_01975 [Bdellovibrionota bacterium]
MKYGIKIATIALFLVAILSLATNGAWGLTSMEPLEAQQYASKEASGKENVAVAEIEANEGQETCSLDSLPARPIDTERLKRFYQQLFLIWPSIFILHLALAWFYCRWSRRPSFAPKCKKDEGHQDEAPLLFSFVSCFFVAFWKVGLLLVGILACIHMALTIL